MRPRLAILFWFYKDAEVCQNRIRHLRRNNRGTPIYGLFIVAFLPRRFLERYAAVRLPQPELGFLEYAIPTYARAFGHRFASDRRFQPFWARDTANLHAPLRKRLLNAVGAELTLGIVLRERLRPGGRRVFHPYYCRYPA